MNERVKFVATMLEAEETFGGTCDASESAEERARRYEAGGVEALLERSPAALSPASSFVSLF